MRHESASRDVYESALGDHAEVLIRNALTRNFMRIQPTDTCDPRLLAARSQLGSFSSPPTI